MEVEPQANVQIGRAVSRDVRCTVADKLCMQQLGDELGVLVDCNRHADVQQEFVRQIENLDILFARVSCVNVPDVLVESESLSATLLAEHQDRPKLILATRASARSRRIAGRDGNFQIAAQRYAEPVMIWIYQAELCANVGITRSVRGFAGSKHRVARRVKALEIKLT